VSNNARGARAITPDGVYKVLIRYASVVGIDIEGSGLHALRATAVTNALEHAADIAKVQQRLGHANISITRIYDRRQLRAEDSPTFKVVYVRPRRIPVYRRRHGCTADAAAASFELFGARHTIWRAL
jgi:integrase